MNKLEQYCLFLGEIESDLMYGSLFEQEDMQVLIIDETIIDYYFSDLRMKSSSKPTIFDDLGDQEEIKQAYDKYIDDIPNLKPIKCIDLLHMLRLYIKENTKA